ncbi:MAG: hypothetical protein QM708_09800 [Propioniciclava sp.]|uniref:hypothetical protein n=1 Tax=Propioniciclava sp. TaxID=2038686 RepID=UPI0039E459CC
MTAVLVDTDIFGSVYVTPDRAAKRGLPVAEWRRALEGVRVFITFQTRAEILAGAFIDRWGGRRVAELRDLLDTTPTIGADASVIDAYARFRADCRTAGHPLYDRPHNADRWNAACAIAKGLPLFAHDGIYTGAPRLTLFKVPGA